MTQPLALRRSSPMRRGAEILGPDAMEMIAQGSDSISSLRHHHHHQYSQHSPSRPVLPHYQHPQLSSSLEVHLVHASTASSQDILGTHVPSYWRGQTRPDHHDSSIRGLHSSSSSDSRLHSSTCHRHSSSTCHLPSRSRQLHRSTSSRWFPTTRLSIHSHSRVQQAHRHPPLRDSRREHMHWMQSRPQIVL